MRHLAAAGGGHAAVVEGAGVEHVQLVDGGLQSVGRVELRGDPLGGVGEPPGLVCQRCLRVDGGVVSVLNNSPQ